MEVTLQGRKFNQHSLADFRQLFCSLTPPPLDQLSGRFQAEFVGPGWLRRMAGPALILGGLGNWWGKEFSGESQGTNLVYHDDTIVPVIPICYMQTPSLVDGRPAVTVSYPKGSRWPWPMIVDELRQLDETTLLGLTIVTKARLQRFAFPFLLHVSS